MCGTGCSGGGLRPALGACGDEFAQQVFRFDLGVGGHELVKASRWDSYVAYAHLGGALVSDYAVELRIGGVHQQGYALAAIPVRRASRAYGELYLVWEAHEAGTELVLILGEGEEAGVR